MPLFILSFLVATFIFPTLIFYCFKKDIIRKHEIIKKLYWIVPALFLALFIFLFFNGTDLLGNSLYPIMTWVAIAFFIIYLPFTFFIIFFLLDQLIGRLFHCKSYLTSFIGLPIAIIFSLLCIYGIFNRYNLEVTHTTIESNDLPKGFDGLKIAVISDTHLGNLTNAKNYFDQLKEAINQEDVDLLFHVGDLVNNLASEGIGYESYFLEMHANIGKYAVMGNHDYGDYYPFRTELGQSRNIEQVKALYDTLGFMLLNDDFVLLEKDSSECIGIIGVENLGKPPFSSYGNLENAVTNHQQVPFNILLSHDPTIWNSDVKKYPSIFLTLSGHTHAAQIGFKIGQKQYSPSQWLFKEWNGLYSDNNQFLYVTRGIGYVGIPARIGMRPELTIITLKSLK